MVAAIGATTAYPTRLPVVSTGGLRVELARYEKALSECVNCATAQTTEGQQEIQRLSSEITRVKARIEEAGRNTNPQNRESIEESRAKPVSGSSAERAPASVATANDRAVGSRIDILA